MLEIFLSVIRMIGVVDDRLHLVGIRHHIGRDIAAVKLHAFHNLGIGFRGLGLLHGDDTVGANLFHRLGDQLADRLVAGRNRSNTGDVVCAVNLLGIRLNTLLPQRLQPSECPS